MAEMSRFYLGTWQFEGLNCRDAKKLIDTAHSVGINKFDTAAVYSDGKAEIILGEEMLENDVVATKVPAVSKHEVNADAAYPLPHIYQSLDGSIRRLKRLPTMALLHNWNVEWETSDLVDKFRAVASKFGIDSIGISLPNGYEGNIENSHIFGMIECIEAPYNGDTPRITLERLAFIALRKNILVRSLFRHGRDANSISSRLSDVLSTGSSVVVGATKPYQIRDWGDIS